MSCRIPKPLPPASVQWRSTRASRTVSSWLSLYSSQMHDSLSFVSPSFWHKSTPLTITHILCFRLTVLRELTKSGVRAVASMRMEAREARREGQDWEWIPIARDFCTYPQAGKTRRFGAPLCGFRPEGPAGNRPDRKGMSNGCPNPRKGTLMTPPPDTDFSLGYPCASFSVPVLSPGIPHLI